jgi:hypothetical protein
MLIKRFRLADVIVRYPKRRFRQMFRHFPLFIHPLNFVLSLSPLVCATLIDEENNNMDSYEVISRIAIVGAGPSGIAAAK